MRDPHSELFAALAAPFDRDEVKARSQSGRSFQYVTARTVMNRLDEVVGPSNWWDHYAPIDNAIVCMLTIRLPDGSTVTKSDAGGITTMADASDSEKSGFSDAFKRAAVKFGVGRYLYGDGAPDYGTTRPLAEPTPAPQIHAPSPAADDPPAAVTGSPRGGRQFYVWCKDNDCVERAGMLGRASGCPPRIVDWSPEQAAAVHRDLLREFDRKRRAAAV